jgi:hypothetical protein
MEINDLVDAVDSEKNKIEETPVQENVEAQEKSTVERPEYVPETYWDNEKNSANLEKAFKDLETERSRAENLRKKLSTGEKITEEYDTIFENVELSEEDRNESKAFVEIARKNGLSKTQAENLVLDMLKTSPELLKNSIKPTRSDIEKQIGEHGSEIIDGLERFAVTQVKNGNWTEDQKMAWANMVYDAESAKVMANILNITQNKQAPFPNTANVASGFDLSQFQAKKNEAWRVLLHEDRAKGQAMVDALDAEYDTYNRTNR